MSAAFATAQRFARVHLRSKVKILELTDLTEFLNLLSRSAAQRSRGLKLAFISLSLNFRSHLDLHQDLSLNSQCLEVGKFGFHLKSE